MISYPNTETYLVNYSGGSCGAFIVTLLSLFVYNLEKSEPSQYGNSHSGMDYCTNLWESESSFTYHQRFYNKEAVHLHVNPANLNNPFILYDHLEPLWKLLFEKYPKCINILITYSKNEIPRLLGNVHFKFLCQYFDNKNNVECWNNIRKKHSYLEEFETPKDVPELLIQKFILHESEIYRIPIIYNDNLKLPELYKDKIIKLRMYDIIYNPEKVMNTLSSITNKPITDAIRETYKSYLDKQEELIKTKMPWLNDK